MRIITRGNYWTLKEIEQIVTERTGKSVKVTIEADVISLTFADELASHEMSDLQTFFGGVHDLPDLNEKAAKETRQVELRAKVARVNDKKLTLPELREVVVALAELMGALDA